MLQNTHSEPKIPAEFYDKYTFDELRQQLRAHLDETLDTLQQQYNSNELKRDINNSPYLQKRFRHKRSSTLQKCPSQGDDSIGNLGFNSFNFLTFMILTFNAVTNINNNINNNNNNNNDISLNSISQTSSSSVSNSDNSIDIMVKILPMPGKKRKRAIGIDGAEDSASQIDIITSEIFNTLRNFMYQAKDTDENCIGYVICKDLKVFMKKMFLEDIIVIPLLKSPSLHPSFLSLLSCAALFPHCARLNELRNTLNWTSPHT